MKYTIVASLLGLLPMLVSAYEELLVFDKSAPTVYYDNLWRENGDPCAPNLWAVGGSDSQLAESLCESDRHSEARPMHEYKTNQIVAIDRRYIEGMDAQSVENRKKFCGKRVRVFRPGPNGEEEEYESAGGPMYVWDGCLECKELGGRKVDFSGPDYLAMTGLGANQCGVGAAEFRFVVTDEQVVEPDGTPPDAVESGLGTFTAGTQQSEQHLDAPGDQVAMFEAMRVKAPPITNLGWTGQTPAGTDNFMGKGPGAGSEGYVDSGAVEGLVHGDTASGAGQAGAGASASASGSTGSTTSAWSGAGSSASNATGSSTSSSQAGQPSASGSGPGADGGAPFATQSGNAPGPVESQGQGQGQGDGSGAPDQQRPPAVDLAAGAGTSASGEGVQPAASGVAQISAGNCQAGTMRCSGQMVQTCGDVEGGIGWTEGPVCPGECKETQPGHPTCF